MVFLFSFTALGIAAQPLLLLYRGFQIAASAAGAADRQSLYVLLITNGLSGLVSLIAVFILSLYGFFSSGVLFSAWLGKRNAAIPAGFTVRQTVNLLFSLSLVFLAAVCSFILAFYLQV